MGLRLAEAEWQRTLAALDGDGGVSIYDRKGRDEHDQRDEQRRAAQDEAADEREGR